MIFYLQGHPLQSDDVLRQRIRKLQSKDITGLTLLELDKLVDGLRIIESKFVYQKQVLDKAFQKALDENNMSLSAQFFVSSLIVDSIIQVIRFKP